MDKQGTLEELKKAKESVAAQKDGDALALELAEKAIERGYECAVLLYNSDTGGASNIYVMHTDVLLRQAAAIIRAVVEDANGEFEKVLKEFANDLRIAFDIEAEAFVNPKG